METPRKSFTRYWLKLSKYGFRNNDDDTIIPTFSKEIIKAADYDYIVKFNKPYIIVGLDEMKKSMAKPVSVDLTQLIKAGLTLFSIPARKKWFVGQRQIYGITKKNKLPKYAKILNVIPTSHKIEYHSAEKKYRVVGANTSPLGYGQWVD